MAKKPYQFPADLTQKIEALQERSKALPLIENAADRYLALNTLEKDTTAIISSTEEAARKFFINKQQSLANKGMGISGFVTVGGTIAACVAFGPPGLAVAAAGALFGFLPFAGLHDSSIRVAYDNVEKLKNETPELIVLGKLSNELGKTREALFETPALVNAIAASVKFPEALSAATEQEKKILTFAFRAAADSRAMTGQDNAPAPVPAKGNLKL